MNAPTQAVNNKHAPIANVALMMELVETLVKRPEWVPGIGVFTGPSGFGKSTAATVAASEYDAIVIEIDPNYTVKHVFKLLCKELGVPENGTTADLSDRLARALMLEPRAVILDEADHLVDNKIIEPVRCVIDRCDGTLVLIGEEKLPGKLSKIERLHSRVMDYIQAEPLAEQDTPYFAEIYAPGISIAPDLYEEMLNASGVSARRLTTNLYRISETARRAGTSELNLAQFYAAGGRFNKGEAPAVRRTLV